MDLSLVLWSVVLNLWLVIVGEGLWLVLIVDWLIV